MELRIRRSDSVQNVVNPDLKTLRMGVNKVERSDTNSHRLAQRQKQIMYGENTQGYDNFINALQRDPSLLKGRLPLKPSIIQRCSNRSWDGQVRKWRRELHMYDFEVVDTELKQQVSNVSSIVATTFPFSTPSPKRTLPVQQPSNEVEVDSPDECTPAPACELETSSISNTGFARRIRYTLDDLLQLAESLIITESEVSLPQNLKWLDKRTDLEEDFEEATDFISSPVNRNSFTKQYTSSLTLSPLSGLSSPRRLFLDKQGEDSILSPIKFPISSSLENRHGSLSRHRHISASPTTLQSVVPPVIPFYT